MSSYLINHQKWETALSLSTGLLNFRELCFYHFFGNRQSIQAKYYSLTKGEIPQEMTPVHAFFSFHILTVKTYI